MRRKYITRSMKVKQRACLKDKKPEAATVVRLRVGYALGRGEACAYANTAAAILLSICTPRTSAS